MQDLDQDLKELYAQQKAEKQKEVDAAQAASTTRCAFFVFSVYSLTLKLIWQ